MIILFVLVAVAIALAVSIYRDMRPKQADLPRSMDSVLAEAGKLWLFMFFLILILIAIAMLFGSPML